MYGRVENHEVDLSGTKILRYWKPKSRTKIRNQNLEHQGLNLFVFLDSFLFLDLGLGK